MMLDAAKKSGNPISDDIYMGDAIINNPESVFDKADVKLNEQYQKTADKVAEIEAKKN